MLVADIKKFFEKKTDNSLNRKNLLFTQKIIGSHFQEVI